MECGHQVFEIQLMTAEERCTYSIMTMYEGGERFAFFAFKVATYNDPVKDWVPTPIPLPLLESKVMLDALTEDLHRLGFIVAVKEDLVFH